MDLKVGDRVMLIGYNGLVFKKPDDVLDIVWLKNTCAEINQIVPFDIPAVGGKIIIRIINDQGEILVNDYDIVYMDEFFEDR